MPAHDLMIANLAAAALLIVALLFVLSDIRRLSNTRTRVRHTTVERAADHRSDRA
jgi:hypothetical protein